MNMLTRSSALFCFLLLLYGLPQPTNAVDVQNIPDAGKPVSGSLVPSDGSGVQVVSHRGEWTTFASMEGAGQSVFFITGQLKNTADKPLTYVKLQFELLGEDGVVMLCDYGYNRKAEALREEAYKAGKKSLADMGIESLAAETQDSFRFLFFAERQSGTGQRGTFFVPRCGRRQYGIEVSPVMQ